MKRKRKPVNKETKSYLRKVIQKLTRKALRLWKERVKERANGVCEICGAKEMVQAHHIESFWVFPHLRYDPHNGVAGCPTHHKFGRESFHKSFIFTYRFLQEKRPDDLQYLLDHWDDCPKILEKKPVEMEIDELKELITYYEKIIFSLDAEKAKKRL